MLTLSHKDIVFLGKEQEYFLWNCSSINGGVWSKRRMEVLICISRICSYNNTFFTQKQDFQFLALHEWLLYDRGESYIECTFRNLGRAYIHAHLITQTCEQMLAVTPVKNWKIRNEGGFEKKLLQLFTGYWIFFNDKTKEIYWEHFNISKKIYMKRHNPLLMKRV